MFSVTGNCRSLSLFSVILSTPLRLRSLVRFLILIQLVNKNLGSITVAVFP